MISHDELLETIAYVKGLHDDGHTTAEVTGLPSALIELGLPMERCLPTPHNGKLICRMDSGKLLEILERRKTRYQN